MRHLSRLLRLAAALCPALLGAQTLHGVVRDSASGAPISGAIVVALGAADSALARTLSDERGAYRLVLPPAARRLRVLHIGFRPVDAPLAPTSATLDVTMALAPALLSAVRIDGASACPRRGDRAQALSLWEQARTGLLAAVVAREARPGTMKLIVYERAMRGTSDSVARQRVRLDSAETSTSFQAVGSAAGFVERGFVREDATGATFLAPDADVLLDPAFATAYCFRLHGRDAMRPHDAGLSFAPARRRDGRVDVEGTLWVDTVARTLRQVEFAYVGLDRAIEDVFRAGGELWFRTMPNGVAFVERWALRLPSVRAEDRGGLRRRVHTLLERRDVGGQVARVGWPDGARWAASLGTLQGTVVSRRGAPLRGVAVRLVDTDYLASPDYRGRIEIPDLLPGPYRVAVIDTAAARAGITTPTSAEFVAEPDSVVTRRIVARAVSDMVGDACRGVPGRAFVARVVAPGGTPVDDARWDVGTHLGDADESIVVSGRANEQGTFVLCPDLSQSDAPTLEVRVWRERFPRDVHIHRLAVNERETTFTLPATKP